VPGAEVLLADTPDAIAEAVLGLIDAPDRGAAIGRKGRQRIRESYGWGASFAKLDRLLGLAEPVAPLAEAVRQ
jgi:glycosyltransferase involved in cell wall biosynthesis